MLGLGSATLALFMLGLIGFFSMNAQDTQLAVGPGGGHGGNGGDAPVTTETTDGSTDITDGTAPGATDPGSPGTTGPGSTNRPGSTKGPGSTQSTSRTSRPTVPEAPPPPGESPLPKGGDATGVSDSAVKYGVHAPDTFNKAPVPLAGPVLRGIKAYTKFFNDNGGVNGRLIDLKIADDEFTTSGAQNAANELIHDEKVFFVAGTLGVDQIEVVAKEAQEANVPYFAGGGHEPLFKHMGVHQILASYDTHVVKLAQFLGTDPAYKGKVIGTLTSDTPQIAPVVTVFDNALKQYGMSVKHNEKVQKPEQQSAQGYERIRVDFRKEGIEVVVPLTDPINTSNLIRECGYSNAQSNCPWTYSFSNFAHDSETALTLFNDEWGRKKVKGLSAGCYPNAPDEQIGNTSICGSMKIAKDQFEAIKGGGKWTGQNPDEHGSSVGYNSAAGYQWMFWKKAMIDQGSSVTRERFLAAIHRYNGYADLVTGPITYKGSSNYAHGAEKMVVWEAQPGNKYKMISNGMVDGF